MQQMREIGRRGIEERGIEERGIEGRGIEMWEDWKCVVIGIWLLYMT
jgi:hypothetical protein